MTNPPPYPEQPTPGSGAPAAPGGGYPAAPAPAYSQPTPTPPGRVLSIVGLVLAFLMAPVGLVISIVAAVKLGKAGQPKGLAIAGIIVGAIITILEIVAIILVVTVFAGLIGMCADLGPGVWEVGGVTYTCG
ncbi:hypothetical protein V8Z69_01480 [Microbacterium aurugineum]|uniref:hypothetical protein n=1 Tax=Microbacterium TaxID=33882 RepID=UPI001E482D7A|nr:hypothetical protein [Microbacterium sp. KKR3/1]MCE0508659.1 hypothetical protein [Microbacterium sp. KKR3/1]